VAISRKPKSYVFMLNDYKVSKHIYITAAVFSHLFEWYYHINGCQIDGILYGYYLLMDNHFYDAGII